MVYVLKSSVDPAWSRLSVNGFTLSEKTAAASRSVNDRITRYLVNGRNVVRLEARVPSGAAATGQVSVVRAVPGIAEDELPPLAQGALEIAPPAVAGEVVLHFEVADVPRWSFADMPAVTGLQADALGAAEVLVRSIADAARAGDADALVDVLRVRLEESAIEFGEPQIERWRTAMGAMLGDPARRITVTPPERWIAEAAMGERVMQIRARDGGYLIAMETEYGDMLLTLGLARLHGQWTVVR